MRPGRIIGVAVLGFLLFFFIAVDLVLFGAVPLNSPLVTVLPIVGLVVGAVLGGLASSRKQARVALPATAVTVPIAPAAAAPPPSAPPPPPPVSSQPPPPPPPPEH